MTPEPLDIEGARRWWAGVFIVLAMAGLGSLRPEWDCVRIRGFDAEAEAPALMLCRERRSGRLAVAPIPPALLLNWPEEEEGPYGEQAPPAP